MNTNSTAIPQVFPLRAVRRKVDVVGNARDGFRVQCSVRPAMEDWWAELSHFQLFSDKLDANAVAQAVIAAEELNLAFWWWVPSNTHLFAALQVPSTCTLAVLPRPGRRKRA